MKERLNEKKHKHLCFIPSTEKGNKSENFSPEIYVLKTSDENSLCCDENADYVEHP